jgi:hypothetical protein
MIKSILKLAASTAACFALISTAPALLNADAATPTTWGPCANDEPEGGPCVWDARHMGDGEGRSLLITRNDRIIFIPHSAAHQLINN